MLPLMEGARIQMNGNWKHTVSEETFYKMY